MTEPAFAALERLYADLDAELARRAPACIARGDCCRFATSGHVLYTTPVELDYLLAHAPAPPAREDGACPYLTTTGRCGVRDHRMLGCRVYFCDPAYTEAMPDVYERFHARVKTLLREQGIPYEYFRFLDRIATTASNPADVGPPRV